MTKQTENKSTINFGHRIDALRLALQALDTDPQAATTVRRMAATLRASCELNKTEELAKLARDVEEATPADLTDRLRTLITRMRLEFAHQEPQRFSILLLSADTPLRNSLSTAFEARGHTVFACNTTTVARQCMKDNPPSFLVVDSVLSGEDGLLLIPELRSNSSTAAMPIVAILPQHADANTPPSLVHEADAYFNKPVDSHAISEFIATRSKRLFEHGRPSRRDPLSGLQNRAAFIEACESHQAMAKQKDEPLSLALIGICDFDMISQECASETIDDLIRRLGSILSSSFRTTDVVARWGRSEFAVTFPGEDHFGVNSALEKVLTIFNRHKVTKPNGKTILIQACAGFSILRPSDVFADVAAQVEGYLFQAKFGCANRTNSFNIISDVIPSSQRVARIALCVGDPALERAITQIIEKDHIEVVALPSTQDALDQLGKSAFNMLIIDDSMPDDGARQLIKSVRESAKLSRLHILILASDEEYVTHALELGVSDYALKPLVASSFMTNLRRSLSRREHSHSSNAFTVMVVDQSIPQLLIAGTVLYQQTGCNVVLAHGFQDALNRFRERTPECMILDFDIPDAALKDFSERLIQLPNFDNVQVVTASVKPHNGNTASLLNIKGRISHPFKPTALLEQLQSIVALPKNSDRSAAGRPPISIEIQRVLSRPH